MINKYCIYFILIFFISGCAYPNISTERLKELTLNSKRHDGETVDIRDFVRPEETKDILNGLYIIGEDEKTSVLRIMRYVQGIKTINDRKDFWQYPGETILKGGDCEDKAFLLLSMIIRSGIKGAYGVKGRCFGSGHMWVEYKDYIADPLRPKQGLIPKEKSRGYIPYFRFDDNEVFYCERKS